MSHTKTQINALRAIPKEKLSVKLQRTVLGLLFVVGAIAGAIAAQWPWYVVVTLALFGATIWSGEIVTGALKIVLAAFKDVWGTVKGPGQG